MEVKNSSKLHILINHFNRFQIRKKCIGLVNNSFHTTILCELLSHPILWTIPASYACWILLKLYENYIEDVLFEPMSLKSGR